MTSIASILQEVSRWPESERLDLLVQLATLMKQQHTYPKLPSDDVGPSVLDLASEYAGMMSGPQDLSVNKRYLDELGET